MDVQPSIIPNMDQKDTTYVDDILVINLMQY